jgi:hypothetical protein
MVHGAVVILLGLAAGIFYWTDIILKRNQEKIRAWRAAHGTLVLFGTLMLVVALIETSSPDAPVSALLLGWIFVTAGYSFACALMIGAATGRRALLPGRHPLDMVLFAGHLIGALGSIVGTVLLFWALSG